MAQVVENLGRRPHWESLGFQILQVGEGLEQGMATTSVLSFAWRILWTEISDSVHGHQRVRLDTDLILLYMFYCCSFHLEKIVPIKSSSTLDFIILCGQ